MCYFVGADGKVTDQVKPEVNAYALDLFYQRHRLHKTFTYPHPVYGDVLVKFSKPLEIPEGRPGGGGWLAPFSVELMEQP